MLLRRLGRTLSSRRTVPASIMKGKESMASGSTKRRDFLTSLEASVQQSWSEAEVYRAEPDPARPKFFVTFPYPYMNGLLHLGHAFSASKCEFAARFQRLMGKNTLLPFGFHCTGMPIPACADKLRKELADNAPGRQTFALKEMGIADEELPKFIDPAYWLSYFPPRAIEDLKSLGVAADWRRSFITTDVNPYYDSFVRWQFETLRREDKIHFGKKHTVYCAKDGQPCADHDRASGEGVGPQEYSLIKIQLVPPFKAPLDALEGRNVYLVAATLRPETMYGQTNCFILPEGMYGAFEMKGGDVFICSERSMRNMAYQDLTAEFGKYVKLIDVPGTSLLGLPLHAPNSPYPTVYSLPMLTILMTKGTGVVTSVPSDAPDDYVTLRELQKKPEWRAKFNITEEMVDFAIVPIIDVPGIGTQAAVTVSEELGIKSNKDKDLLTQAKDKVYLKGFTDGVMIVGPHTGLKVSAAKPVIRQEMIAAGQAVPYWEPEKQVVSRSGEECVVGLVDQWFLKYGEPEWKAAVKHHLKTVFNGFTPITHKEFDEALEWFSEWALSRTYGLGTRLPWDPKFLIESLSDSTIYMAYYTVCHLLHSDVSGHVVGPAGISADQMTGEVWDYVFLKSEEAPTHIPREKLEEMRTQFQYWYPLDLRCSAKDLIRNHLTMSLYNHAAVWKNRPDLWPRSFFCNGYSLLNGKKMSKSTGNFLTIRDVVKKFGADATRVVLADAGDTIEDANVEEKGADSAVLKLFTLREWIVDHFEQLERMRTGPFTYFDSIFENELNRTITEARKHYSDMQFREALKTVFFDLVSVKEEYVLQARDMHRDLFLLYAKTQALLLSPIAPHLCEAIWTLLRPHTEGFIVNQRFPEPTKAVDYVLLRQVKYIREVERTARTLYEKAGKKKGPKLTHSFVFVAREFPQLQQDVLRLLTATHTANPACTQADFLTAVRSQMQGDKKAMQKILQFASFVLVIST